MLNCRVANGFVAGWFAALAIIGAPLVAAAQTPPKTAAKKSPPASKLAKPVEPAASAKPAEPATPEAAAKVLDLRTFPLMEGAKVGGIHTLAILMYEAKGTPQAAFEFQRRELAKRGFKELPGGYSSADTNSGHFTKEGFTVAVSSSPGYDPAKKGWSNVTLVNNGNVDLQKLPVPPGVKPFHPQPTEASYTTTAKPVETAVACRKLLLAAGWEPYGEASPDALQPDSSMQYFKRNGIKLQSWIMTTPAEGGKTLIRYSTDLLSADLPAPPGTDDPDYNDSQKTLRFAAAADKSDAIIAFYKERLTKMGWKATTDKPIVDDQKNTKFLIFRNTAKELLSLDLDVYEDKVEVKLFHQTAAELAEEERLAKEHAEKEKLAEAERNKKFTVRVPLPAEAENLDKVSERTIEFELATGSGPKALAALRDHYVKEGWTEEEGNGVREEHRRHGNEEGGSVARLQLFRYGNHGRFDPSLGLVQCRAGNGRREGYSSGRQAGRRYCEFQARQEAHRSGDSRTARSAAGSGDPRRRQSPARKGPEGSRSKAGSRQEAVAACGWSLRAVAQLREPLRSSSILVRLRRIAGEIVFLERVAAQVEELFVLEVRPVDVFPVLAHERLRRRDEVLVA